MAQGKQAKIITRPQERAILDHLRYTRNPDRDCVLFLLSLKAGLRAKEIAALNWSMVTDASGHVSEAIAHTVNGVILHRVSNPAKDKDDD